MPVYPCLCLCFGFTQTTRTTPLLFTILHLAQIFFTELLTFISANEPLLVYVPRQCPGVLPENLRPEGPSHSYFERYVILPRVRS